MDATTITLVIAGIVAIIGAISAAAVAIIKELRLTKNEVKATVVETKAVVENNASNGAQAGDLRDKKLDKIEILVDGRYSEVLQELATLQMLLAHSTGTEVDMNKARTAQDKANEQQVRVDISKK